MDMGDSEESVQSSVQQSESMESADLRGLHAEYERTHPVRSKREPYVRSKSFGKFLAERIAELEAALLEIAKAGHSNGNECDALIDQEAPCSCGWKAAADALGKRRLASD